MRILLAPALGALIALWYTADRYVHGNFDARGLLAHALPALLAGLILALRRRESAPASVDPEAARASAVFVGALFGLALASGATLFELLLRTRPDDSTATLMTALVLHWSAASVVSVGTATALAGRALAPVAGSAKPASV